MKRLAPDIFRQRLLIEGYYTRTINETDVKDYLISLASALKLRIYGDPVVYSPASGMGKEENAGYDAFVPLIDSGISIYIWSKQKFFSAVIYTCKEFDEDKAKSFTHKYFEMESEIYSMSF